MDNQPPLVYYAFDLLSLDGTGLRSRPLVEWRKLLEGLLRKAQENIRFSEELRGNREELLQLAQQFQLEGFVAKRPDSVYESGRRSGAWVKVKLTQEQEFAIGGYTPLLSLEVARMVGAESKAGHSRLFPGASLHRSFARLHQPSYCPFRANIKY
jgi:ATP-dependent DNA ligase